MKKLTTMFVALLTITWAASAQTAYQTKKGDYSQDKFSIKGYTSFSLIPVTVKGTFTDYEHNQTSFFSHPVVEDYRVVDTTGQLLGVFGGVGLKIPFYRTSTWSVGADLNAGIGTHASLRAVEGLGGSVVFDFQEYLYYRNFTSSWLDISFLAGYKYTRAPLRYHMPVAAVEFHFSKTSSIRLYSSVRPYHYYLYYTNGKEEPGVTIKEHGFSLNVNF